MGYDLTIRHRGRRAAAGDQLLHLSVWEMSRIRDRMLATGAAFCVTPPADGALAERYRGHERGIPAYKLSMIDDVVVHRSEIRQALTLLAAAPANTDEADPLWKTWIDFLERAAEAGGFTVE